MQSPSSCLPAGRAISRPFLMASENVFLRPRHCTVLFPPLCRRICTFFPFSRKGASGVHEESAWCVPLRDPRRLMMTFLLMVWRSARVERRAVSFSFSLCVRMGRNPPVGVDGGFRGTKTVHFSFRGAEGPVRGRNGDASPSDRLGDGSSFSSGLDEVALSSRTWTCFSFPPPPWAREQKNCEGSSGVNSGRDQVFYGFL